MRGGRGGRGGGGRGGGRGGGSASNNGADHNSSTGHSVHMRGLPFSASNQASKNVAQINSYLLQTGDILHELIISAAVANIIYIQLED